MMINRGKKSDEYYNRFKFKLSLLILSLLIAQKSRSVPSDTGTHEQYTQSLVVNGVEGSSAGEIFFRRQKRQKSETGRQCVTPVKILLVRFGSRVCTGHIQQQKQHFLSLMA